MKTSVESERAQIATIEGWAITGAIEPLLEALADSRWRVRRSVVTALASIGDRAIGPLVDLLCRARDDENRIAAVVDALVSSASSLSAELRLLAEHPDPAVVADAAVVIGRRRRPDDAPLLIPLVTHANDNVAVAATEALAKIGGRTAVAVLLPILESGSFFRVFPAIDALGRTRDPRVVAPLAKLLADPTYHLEATRALGHTGELTAIPPLARLLTQPSESVVRVAAVALHALIRNHQQRYGTSVRATQLLRDAARAPTTAGKLAGALGSAVGDEQVALAFVLGVVGDTTVIGDLMPLLEMDPAQASVAAASIRQLTQANPERLGDALASGTSVQRRSLLPLVVSIRAATSVIAALDDPDPEVRTLACRALARIGATAGIPALFAHLADESAGVAQAAQSAILSLGTTESLQLALAAASDVRPTVRRAALRILATNGDDRALPHFLAAIREGDARLADVAVGGLALLSTPEAFAALLEVTQSTDDRVRSAAMRALGRTESTSPEIASTLSAALSDPRPWVRYYAAQAHGRRATPGVSKELVPLLDDPAGQVRVAAVEALASDDSVSFDALVRAEASGDADMQRAALMGLANSQRSDPEPTLVRASASSDPATRLVALGALAQRGSPHLIERLRESLHDGDELVQRAAAAHAANMASGDATHLLLDALWSGGDRVHLLALLSQPSEPAIAEIERTIARVDDDDRAADLTQILLRMGSPRAQEALLAAMFSPSACVRRATAATLQVLGSPDAMSLLVDGASRDEDPTVRRICAALIGA